MNCDTTESRLKAWIDGELDTRTGREVETHVAGCAGCADRVADYRRLGELIQRAEIAAVGGGQPGVIYEKARVARRDEEGVIRLLRRTAVTAAAVLVLAVTVAVAKSPARGGSPLARNAETTLENPNRVDDEALEAFLRNLELAVVDGGY
ncbi:MAG: zf-HC2 domain-containing protein [Planctomycetota bacterium]|nr:zf-HC2 domain-containing protein [Planctomycetota bacterium]